MSEPRKITQPFAEFQQEAAAGRAPDPVAEARTRQELRAAQEREWGVFVAADRINSASGALAFLPGHAVPVSSVSDDGPVLPGQVALARDGEGKLTPHAQAFADAVPKSGAPAGNASTEDWRAYATANGVPEEEAAGMSRDELKARLEGV